ncbi:terminase TerL endonuclease subunit [Anaeromicropila populeti]|uniref:Phage terminase-like protein, large subunit, contains N-terminal HTH domain n=1 Tax=Anaeromicropila populeti TaxID=37658 RepID=A0A1I6LRA0_9FIRM|nr:terminase TerL endonuclease subunit [Anaeromicropila populeti]SFS05919.1 Phage terminase-like protein, large subunit, contains N-terminal HTH domain [Anaeromicropila populeti]
MYSKEKAEHVVRFIHCLNHTKGQWRGLPFDLLPWQDKIIRDVFGTVKANGYRQYNTAYVEIPKKNGKQLEVNTVIPTPDGFTTMGNLKVGDFVLDETGKPCHVVAFSEIDDTEQAYRIHFRDGSSIVAGARHLWKVQVTNNGKREKIISTEEMYEKQKRKNNQENRALFRIPIAGAFLLSEKTLPIDPYLYGFWIGNGNAVKPEITVMRDDVEEVKRNIPYPIQKQYQQAGHSDILVYQELKSVLVRDFTKKRIPIRYRRASISQRKRLLNGLMDSDGCISTVRGQSVYVTILPELAEEVQDLLWSLGIKNTRKTTPSTRFGIPTGETCYLIRFTAFEDQMISGLERKEKGKRKRNPRSCSHFHYISYIEKAEKCKMRCIQVDSPSRLYLAGRSMIPTHNSELAAAVALYMTCGDGEWGAEVYGCASDRQQASIVFDVAVDMVEQCPALKKRIKPIMSVKRLVYKPTNSYYQVLSAEAYTKHGLNVHAVIFDELHSQPNRELFDVMTKGSGDARTQPLYFLITTAGTDRHSICYEQHQKAEDISLGRKVDPTFYPVIYGICDEEDWGSEDSWYKANPSLGHTIDIEKVRNAYLSAKENPAEENIFRQLRLNQWVKQSTRWMPMEKWDKCAFSIDRESLKGRECYGGLDLSSTTDITAFVLLFPPRNADEKYIILPYFWIPEENMKLRVKRDHVPYDIWEQQGFLKTTEGNVIHYGFIEKFIEELGMLYHIKEIAFDRWGAVQMVQNLEGMGFTVVPFGQGYKDMSPPSKELMKLTFEEKLAHGGHMVLRWMMDNIFIKQDPAGNIKPDKEKSTEKIDGAVATIMALDRAIRNTGNSGSVYDDRGVLVF